MKQQVLNEKEDSRTLDDESKAKLAQEEAEWREAGRGGGGCQGGKAQMEPPAGNLRCRTGS